MKNDYDPYQALAIAILTQVTRDWRQSPPARPSIEKFFGSDWFVTLCDVADVNHVVARQICDLGTRHFEKTKQTLKKAALAKKARSRGRAHPQVQRG